MNKMIAVISIVIYTIITIAIETYIQALHTDHANEQYTYYTRTCTRIHIGIRVRKRTHTHTCNPFVQIFISNYTKRKD